MTNKPEDRINTLRNEMGKVINAQGTEFKRNKLLTDEHENRINQLEAIVKQLDNALGWAIGEIKKLQEAPIPQSEEVGENFEPEPVGEDTT